MEVDGTASSARSSKSRRKRRQRARVASKDGWEHATYHGLTTFAGVSQTRTPRDVWVQEWLDSNPSLKRTEFWDYEMRMADLNAQLVHLKLYDRPPCTEIRGKIVENFVASMDRWRAKFASDIRLKFIDVDPLHTTFDPSTSPGFGYRARTKADAYERALPRACRSFDLLCSGRWVPYLPAKSGGRGALRSTSSDRTVKSGRLVWGVNFEVHLVAGASAQALTSAFIDRGGCGTALGMPWAHGGVTDFVCMYGHRSKFISADVSRYDSSIEPWMIAMVLDLFRTLFVDDSPAHDMYWEYVYQTIVHMPVVLQDGRCVQPHVGMVSGHPYTSVLESVLSWILADAACGHSDDTDIITLGDDIFIATDDDSVSLSSVVREFAFYGITIAPDKSVEVNELQVPTSPERGAPFLSKFFCEGLPWRPLLDSQLILIHPENEVRSAAHSRAIAIGLSMDNAGNFEFHAWVNEYLDWLERRYPESLSPVEPPAYVRNRVGPIDASNYQRRLSSEELCSLYLPTSWE